jgi:hypothetical protein
MAADGRYHNPVGGRSGDPAYGELKELVVAIKVQMKTNGDEIAEIKKQVQGISRVLTMVEATLPNLVTKADCANSRSDITKDHAHVVQDLKDRMEGRREVTGVHQTLPEMLAQQIIAERKQSKKKDSNPPLPTSPKDAKGPIYWLKVVSAIISVTLALSGAFVFINRYIEDQQESSARTRRIEEALRGMGGHIPVADKASKAASSQE